MRPQHFAFVPALAVSFLLAACGSPFAEAPPVADSTFVSALAELHLAEARLRGDDRPYVDTMQVTLPPEVRDSILVRHGMSRRSFQTTLSFYVEHPEQYAALYARVVDTLNAEQQTLRFGSDQRPVPPEKRSATPPAFQEAERD